MNMHNRLSNQSLIFANRTPMSTICQHFNTIDVEVCFTRMWGFYLEGVWLWRTKWGILTGGERRSIERRM